jgi:uncharacterized membrane protein YeaQ/YmgE (transglycosylase-associated protein family)
MIGFLLWLFILGMIAGFVARFLVPGRDPLGFLGTVALGVVGSFVGGFLGSLIFEQQLTLRTTGILGSIVGAVIALLIYRRLVDRKA